MVSIFSFQAAILKRVLALIISPSIVIVSLLVMVWAINPMNDIEAQGRGCPTFPATAENETELNTAISCYNAINIPGTYALTLTDDISLTASLVPIDNPINVVSLLLDGANNTVDGQGITGVRPFNIAPLSNLTMQAITITQGNASQGGAIYNEGDVTVVDGHFIDNSADFGGGAIYNLGNLTVSDSSFISNTAAGSGGAIEGFGGLLYLTDNLFQGNQAGADAGAIWVEGMINFIGRSIFNNNSAQGAGGAIVTEATVSMGFMTMSGNSAQNHGGALVVRGLINFVNSTISDNTAGFGGGISVVDNGVLNLNNVTLSSNSGLTATGGLSLTAGSTAYVLNSIIANSNGADCAGPGDFNDLRYNLFEDGSCISDPTSISGDPVLGSLTFNSGVPGILYHLPTHALLPGSAAIDAIPNGQNSCGSGTEDQRGVSRPQGSGCDIGAFEAAILSLDVVVDGGGWVNGSGISCLPDCSEDYYESAVITLTASADTGFVFAGWSGDCGGTADCILVMDSPKNVTATFNEAAFRAFLSAVFSDN